MMRDSEHGSVMVLTAVAIFPLMFLLAFAIDVSHWFDYSRNLQNRADAAAFAGAQMYSNLCFTGGQPGNTTNGGQSTIGKWAQLYSGAGVNEPSGNLPYTDAQVSAATTLAAGSGTGPGTGWDVGANGYANNTTSGTAPAPNPLTLKLGALRDFLMVINGNDYYENGGRNWTMNAAAAGADFCTSDPAYDRSDTECFGHTSLTPGSQLFNDCKAGAFIDVKLTQRNLPLFFPLISSLTPTIHAHARVSLQGEASSGNTRPIAVSDPGAFGCVRVVWKDATTNSELGHADLQQDPAGSSVWDNVSQQFDTSGNLIANTGPQPVPIPAGHNVYVQPFLSDCNGTGQTFDDTTNTGVLTINSHPTGITTVNTGDAPKLTNGGVFLVNNNCSPDQYFNGATADCSAEVDAYVKFDPGIPQNKTKVFYIDQQWDPTANGGAGGFVAVGNPTQLTQDNSDPTHWSSRNNQMLTIGQSSGDHRIEITWEQDAAAPSGTLTTCTQSVSCHGTFDVQAGVFGACNGCDQPDDSGPIVLAESGQVNGGVVSWTTNSFAGGSTPNLVVKLQLAGIRATDPATEPLTILRFPVKSNHQTGLIDCGQGNNSNWDAYVIFGGCGPGNPYIGNPLPNMNPLFLWARTDGTGCAPAQDQNFTGWPDLNHQDCVRTTPGSRRQNIICALVLRITGQSVTGNCQGGAGGTCPAYNWPRPPGIDARKIGMILTSPIDLAAADGAPQFWIPIRRFATFYIAGWDQNIKPQCGGATFPGKGKQSQNAAVWGYWMDDSDTSGTTDGKGCDTSSLEPTNCVPSLTR
jgi:hypothetical protein